MATERSYVCKTCQKKTYPQYLFDSLRDLSKEESPKCECGGTQELRLNFNFGLGAGKAQCRVLDAFLPSDEELKSVSWADDGGKPVRFYPFLVVLERTETPDRSFWLPYWHIVKAVGTGNDLVESVAEGEPKERKYGQWAPHMDDFLFKSLIRQASEKGYLTEESAAAV